MNLLLIAVILGVVEGVTEFLPVSSTGHLIVAGRLLGFEGAKQATFEIFIQLGAILAVVVVERRRFIGLLMPPAGSRFSGVRGCALLGITTLPALFAGYLLHDLIKARLWGPVTVAGAWFVGGIVLLLVEHFLIAHRTLSLDDLDYRQAAIIGLCQCLALWPGVSRAAATIVGGMLCGLDRRTAASYSFLAAVPVLTAATFFELFKSRALLQPADALPFAVGFLVSFLAAWAAVRGFVALLSRGTLRPFAWYRIAVAPVVYWFVR